MCSSHSRPEELEGAEGTVEEPVEEVVFKKPDTLAAPQHDRTIKGGRYIEANGDLRNAHGQLIDGTGKVLDGTTTPLPPKME